MKKCPKCGEACFSLAGDAYDSVLYLVNIEDDGSPTTIQAEAGNEEVENTDWHGDVECSACWARFDRASFQPLQHDEPLLPYTVLLLYPDYLASIFGQEIYRDQVYARNAGEAIEFAQRHALKANDVWAAEDGADPSDFYPLFTVRGHWEDLAPPELQV